MEVDRFLSDSMRFSESAPRPPVPGEENELHSNGGISTKSSGSHKTHSSGKSERSNKSRSPAATPRRSNLDRTGGSLSCSDTKLNGDEDAPLGFEPEGSAECGNTPPFIETRDGTPPYSKWAENLRHLLKDSEGVKLFKKFLDLEDCSNTLDFWFACQGVKLVPPSDIGKVASLLKLIYKKYIKGDSLKLDPKVKRNIAERLKKEKYEQTLFDDAQSNVEDIMRNDSYPLFLKSDIYVLYVQNGGESPKSGAEVSGNDTSGSNSVRQMPSVLQTVPEERELREEDIKSQPPMLPLNPDTIAATTNIRALPSRTFKRPEGIYTNMHSRHPSYRAAPYHYSYAPVSERDSENTSDAHTDDTMSLTDSSVDGRDAPYGSKRWKKTMKAIRNVQLSSNKRTGLDQHIPRTQRLAATDRNLAEKDPKAFAAVLINRLEKLLESNDKLEHVKSLKLEPTTDEESDHGVATTTTMAACQSMPPPSQPPNKPLSGFLLAMLDNKDDDPQSIIDEHFNRVWHSSSTGQTPSRSPGRISPDRSLLAKSFMAGAGSNNVSAIHHPSFTLPSTSKGHHHDMTFPGTGVGGKSHHRKKDKDSGIGGGSSSGMLSFDSSGVMDETANKHSLSYHHEEPHNYKHIQVHHQHYHHHHISGSGRNKESSTSGGKLRGNEHEKSDAWNTSYSKGNPARGSSGYSAGDRFPSGGLHDTSSSHRPRNSSKDASRQTSSSSGKQQIANAEVGDLRVPNLHDPSNEKVLAWILENEKISSGNNPQYSTDGSDRGSSHKRSSHKSGSSSKKMDANRSLSLDHSLPHSYSFPGGGITGGNPVTPGGLVVQPAQPIIQDPSMPLLTPPNPTVQLEEARRRLQDEKRVQSGLPQSRSLNTSHNTSMMSSSSQPVTPNTRDKRAMPPPPLPPRAVLTQSQQTPAGAKTAAPPPIPSHIPAKPLDLSAVEDISGPPTSSKEKSMRKPAPPPLNISTQSSSSQGPASSIVVGYYFCGEPIPYRTTFHSSQISLGQFKQLISKRGTYRYFFRKASDEFDSGVVYEEVLDDSDHLPLCEGKVIGKVEKIE